MLSHFAGVNSRVFIVVGAACVFSLATVSTLMKTKQRSGKSFIDSPRNSLAHFSADEISRLPYPPDVLPGGRDVTTPYGSIRVFEWGPEDGQKFLFLHGISTPVISLGDMAHELVGKGYRVMLFDLFGRGYSDAPVDVPYDMRLYTTQILLVLASSPLSWDSFHLVGYSLGGCLAVSFARYFPQRLDSLILIAGGGLIRPYHVGWQSKLLYNSGLLPESLVRWLVRRRIRPSPSAAESPAEEPAGGPVDILAAESKQVRRSGNGDASGGQGFDSASISKYRPDVSVSSVVSWQIDHHQGFVGAFLSTIRSAPIYAPQGDWEVLAEILSERRSAHSRKRQPRGMKRGKVLMVLGKDDPVVVPSETIEDAEAILGESGVEAVVLDAGHEVNIKCSREIGDHIDRFVQS